MRTPPDTPGRSRVAGKVAFVVGAGTDGDGWGNGKAAAFVLAHEGAMVFAVDRDQQAAEATAYAIEGIGGICYPFSADVTSEADVKRAVDACLARFDRLDLVHHNVGIFRPGGVVDSSPSDWQLVVETNLTTAFLVLKHALPELTSPGGAVVHVSSVSALRYTGNSHVAYAASKAGLIQLTRVTALEYAKIGIRINAVVPGLMDTPMLRRMIASAGGDVDEGLHSLSERCPVGFLGDAWDVAYAALFLLSDEARFVTGTTLVVDGGLSSSV